MPASPLTQYQPACKPGSVWHATEVTYVTAIPLARRLPGASSNLPERQIRTDPRFPSRRSYSVLLPVGFAVPPALPQTRCALTAPFHPCPLPTPSSFATSGGGLVGPGGLFSVALSLGSRPPDVIRHRMSMEPGLSSRSHLSASPRAAVRPTDTLRDGVRAGDRQACSGGAGAGVAEACSFSRSHASRAASSAFSVATVETSMLPSTRCGRKWRWKAATTARVTPSK